MGDEDISDPLQLFFKTCKAMIDATDLEQFPEYNENYLVDFLKKVRTENNYSDINCDASETKLVLDLVHKICTDLSFKDFSPRWIMYHHYNLTFDESFLQKAFIENHLEILESKHYGIMDIFNEVPNYEDVLVQVVSNETQSKRVQERALDYLSNNRMVMTSLEIICKMKTGFKLNIDDVLKKIFDSDGDIRTNLDLRYPLFEKYAESLIEVIPSEISLDNQILLCKLLSCISISKSNKLCIELAFEPKIHSIHKCKIISLIRKDEQTSYTNKLLKLYSGTDGLNLKKKIKSCLFRTFHPDLDVNLLIKSITNNHQNREISLSLLAYQPHEKALIPLLELSESDVKLSIDSEKNLINAVSKFLASSVTKFLWNELSRNTNEEIRELVLLKLIDRMPISIFLKHIPEHTILTNNCCISLHDRLTAGRAFSPMLYRLLKRENMDISFLIHNMNFLSHIPDADRTILHLNELNKSLHNGADLKKYSEFKDMFWFVELTTAIENCIPNVNLESLQKTLSGKVNGCLVKHYQAYLDKYELQQEEFHQFVLKLNQYLLFYDPTDSYEVRKNMRNELVPFKSKSTEKLLQADSSLRKLLRDYWSHKDFIEKPIYWVTLENTVSQIIERIESKRPCFESFRVSFSNISNSDLTMPQLLKILTHRNVKIEETHVTLGKFLVDYKCIDYNLEIVLKFLHSTERNTGRVGYINLILPQLTPENIPTFLKGLKSAPQLLRLFFERYENTFQEEIIVLEAINQYTPSYDTIKIYIPNYEVEFKAMRELYAKRAAIGDPDVNIKTKLIMPELNRLVDDKVFDSLNKKEIKTIKRNMKNEVLAYLKLLAFEKIDAKPEEKIDILKLLDRLNTDTRIRKIVKELEKTPHPYPNDPVWEHTINVFRKINTENLDSGRARTGPKFTYRPR